MQYHKMQGVLKCPNCDQTMQGVSISYHHYKCLSCGTEVNGLGIRTNQGFEQIVGAICVIGFLALFVSILK
jgi:ribosomal protein L37AE/L43A